MIEVKNVRKSYPDGKNNINVLADINFELEAASSLSLTGESGSGKSTLLHLLAGLDATDAGSISIDSQDISNLTEVEADTFRKTKVGIVFQRFNLVDCLSGLDNVGLPARLNGNFDRDYIQSLLNKLSIEKLAHKYPVDMSGGEQQRFAIARALAGKPKLLLADEPTGNLDDKTSGMVSDLLFDLCKEFGTTLVIVTHSQQLASQAQRHLHLCGGKLVSP